MKQGDLLQGIIDKASEFIVGKQQTIRFALACFLARGHLLIEDVPGVGKTTLAHVMATILGLQYQRVQFTSDLLPADIIGSAIFDRENQVFRFHQGPIFSQLVLADEINRATPKTQSALLEAMEERQITADGITHSLPAPFFVVATQNPLDQIGTFPLPESQLDRFLMRIKIGYPDRSAERQLLTGEDRREMLRNLEAVVDLETLINLQGLVGQQTVSPALLDYVQNIVDYTRQSGLFRYGLSPRAGLALIHCARAWSMLEKRDRVLPEDIQAVLGAVVCHRLDMNGDSQATNYDNLAQSIIETVPVR